MATYPYRCECGKTFTVDKPMSESSREERCECGLVATRVYECPQIMFGSWKPSYGEKLNPANAEKEAMAAGMYD